MRQIPREKGTTALFKNPYLEKLTRTHISVPLTIYFIGSAAMLYINFSRGYTTILQAIGIFFLAFFFWTWFEYMMHKHLFHMLPTSKIREKIQYTFHGVHHEYPRDKTRLAMPPAASIMILVALYFFCLLIMGKYTYTFLPGFIMGYSMYLLIHYSIHAFRPPRNFLGQIWVLHSVHHYKDDSNAFGVSSPLWDYIYGTLPENTYKRKKRPNLAKKQAVHST